MSTVRVLDVGSCFGMDATNFFSGWVRQFPDEDIELVRVRQNSSMKDVKENLRTCDLVYFGGGQDVHPSLYGHKNVASGVGHLPSLRDIFEKQVFEDAVSNNIPIFGICRGAQLLCALSGGSLVQDVEGHGVTHPIYAVTVDKGECSIGMMPSTHHQMMNIWGLKSAMLLAWTPIRSKRYVRDETKVPQYKQNIDPEIVYFNNTRALAVQGHPEYLETDSPIPMHVRSMIKTYCEV